MRSAEGQLTSPGSALAHRIPAGSPISQSEGSFRANNRAKKPRSTTATPNSFCGAPRHFSGPPARREKARGSDAPMSVTTPEVDEARD